ncbi:hypothetical protein F383_33086 [Gossypium arboreum]|uniref:Uncharacterized protein n=1 Tax=Gossypium arboreum TaxID=29729 RepID=A0A0B0PQM9_GOSAR|nr:hypothetical protein F383_28624 [Gossypium arboreum]KHG27167.1 hypothetical protein F383_33086 [Gossypium arboreum]
MHVPDMSYTSTSHSRRMSKTCLTLAKISRLMHVPDMSYTSPRLNADAMSQTWSYTGIQISCIAMVQPRFFPSIH